MESYYIIIRNYPCENDLEDPRRVPSAPWDPQGRPGHEPGTPGHHRGRPWDPPGTSGDPTDYNNGYISTNTYSAISSRLLHRNPFVATHLPNASSGLFYSVHVENGALFGRPQGRAGGAPRFHEGVNVHGRKESAHSAPGPGSPLFPKQALA